MSVTFLRGRDRDSSVTRGDGLVTLKKPLERVRHVCELYGDGHTQTAVVVVVIVVAVVASWPNPPARRDRARGAAGGRVVGRAVYGLAVRRSTGNTTPTVSALDRRPLDDRVGVTPGTSAGKSYYTVLRPSLSSYRIE